MIFPASREEALKRLHEFIPTAGLYARDRNFVKPGHPSVSRLSPAIRHRLITEEEVVSAVLKRHSFGRVEKFIQEVYWRRYWKSWLSMRPEVWSDYQDALGDRQVEISQTGNAVMDYFVNELVTTGYLHNHARMWFAAWWVHQARLPWQSGAAFFLRHLLDGDPASNTLSWRWVAGLQTPGKTYLTRRSNLEKYLAPELLDALADGLADFEHPEACNPSGLPKPVITRREFPAEDLDEAKTVGLWIHEEDLAVETSALAQRSFAAIAVTGDLTSWERYQFPAAKKQWIRAALEDAAARAGTAWKSPVSLETNVPHIESLIAWAKSNQLQQVMTLRPEVGPLDDSLPRLRSALAEEGIRLLLVDRPEDLRLRPFATSGFFPFWEAVRKGHIVTPPENAAFARQQMLFE